MRVFFCAICLTFTGCWKIIKVYFAVGKICFFPPPKLRNLSYWSITTGLHFIWIKTENVANTCPHTDALPRKGQQFQDERRWREWRDYLELKSIKSGRWHQNVWQYFGLSLELQTLHQGCGVCCVLEIAWNQRQLVRIKVLLYTYINYEILAKTLDYFGLTLLMYVKC